MFKSQPVILYIILNRLYDHVEKNSLKLSFKELLKTHGSGLVFKLQKVDEYSITSHQLKFSMKSSTLSCLICAQNLLEVARTATVVLYWPKVAQKMLSTMRTALFTNTIGPKIACLLNNKE